MAEFVARRPKLVIALWVLLLLLSTPLAPMLEKYISYSESKWLPSNAESIRASKILENLGGGRGSSVFLVVVSSRPFAIDSAMIVEKMTERFASEYGVKADVIGPAGIAELVAENLALILEGGLKAVNGTAKGFYSVALAASEAYKGAKKGAIAAWMLVQGYLTLLKRAREIYDGVKNATSMFTTYYSYLSKGLQELDKAYAMVLSTMKTLHHVAWPFASCNLTNRSSYTPPSPETAVGELLQAIESVNETVPAKISGFSIGVNELVKIMKYVEELGPCPSEADYRSAAKTYIASVVEEKYGASMARLVKALLDLIDAFGGPGLQPTKTKSVVEYVFTKLLGKMLAQYGLSLPPSWIKKIV
ncbi:MAG TPA: hypothetical protein EYP81_02725, partial [Thermodesulfobacteriaceae bacterium]|nr:hypothetical protein [Thermodesulfobacteriaceae bacterium]